jgi:hypothetical protein
MRLGLLHVVGIEMDEGHVGVFRGEVAAFARAAGVHQRRKRLLDRLRHREAFADAKILAVEIEFLVARPEQLHDLDPLRRVVVAGVVLHDVAAKHFELGREPAADDVERETAVADVIDGRRLLRRHDRMDGRHVRGGQDAGALGRLGDAGRPGISVEIGAVEIGLAAKAFPASDRHQRLVAEAVGGCADRQRLGPARPEAILGRGDGAAIADIDAEEAELQPVGAEERIGRGTRIGRSHCALRLAGQKAKA